MEIRNYMPRNILKYLASAGLAGSLLLSGCATTQNNSRQTQLNGHPKYQMKQEEKRDYKKEESVLVNGVGTFIVDGLIRLLVH